MLREYSEAVHSLNEIEKILLKQAIRALNKALEPGWESLNLSSLGIEEFINTCKQAINEFRDVKKNVEKHAGTIEEFVHAIEEAQLLREFDFEQKKDQLYNPMEFLAHFDEHMRRVVSENVEKYNMIGA
jgi:dynein heavy chain